MKKNIQLYFIAIFLISCGARKTELAKKEESIKKDFSGFFRNSGNSEEFLNQDFNIRKWSLLKVDTQNDIETEEITVEPDDPTKPSSYTDPNGKKHIFENSKMTNKKTKSQNRTKSENSQNSDESLKLELQKKREQELIVAAKLKEEAAKLEAIKNTKRDQWSLWNLLWILIPIGLILLIIALWKKYKSKNPIS